VGAVSQRRSKQANGATIAAHGDGYVYRAADGTATFFEPFGGFNACTASSTTTCRFVPTSIVGADGRKVELYYDRWNICGNAIDDCTVDAVRLSQVRNSFGYLIEFQYAAGGSGGPSSPGNAWYQRTSATFSNDIVGGGTLASVSYSYPSSGVTEVTDMDGRVWRFTGSGRITGIRRPGAASDTTVIAYSGNEVTSVTRDGVTTNYSRSPNGSNVTTTVTNALNQATTVVSDLNVGRPVSITDPLNRTTSYQYDPSGRLTRQTEPEGNYVQYTHDARGNVTQTQAVPKPGSSTPTITTSASFDANCSNPVKCNQPNSTTDGRGNVTDYSYDPTHGGLLTITAPTASNGIRPQTRYAYTLLNGEYQLTDVSACQTQSSCVGTADEVKTTIAYDANGNVTSTSSGAGDGSLTATNLMTYDAKGDVTSMDGPLPGADDTTRFRYNATRERIGTISPDPDGAGVLKHRAQRISYGAYGQALKSEAGTVNSQTDADWAAFNALEAVEIGYDDNARPVTQAVTSAGTTYALTHTSYDALGRPECTAQRMNPAAFGSLPGSACTLGSEGSFGPDRIVKSVYNAAGDVTQVRSAVGTADEAAEATSTYTNNGQVQTLTDGENNKTSYEYDGHDGWRGPFIQCRRKALRLARPRIMSS
jgi:YD repeat-containing protein